MLDQQIVALAKAIRQQETGNRPIAGATGELSSRYQFLPSTWSTEAKRILGNASAPLTAENENKVAYTRMLEWKNKGYNPGQIASMWNSGNPDMFAKGNQGVGASSSNPNVQFNVPQYVNNVFKLYEQYKPAPFQEIISSEKQADTNSAEQYKPTFQGTQVLPQFSADTNQKTSYATSLGKQALNIPSSLYNLGKGIVNFMFPKQQVEDLGSTVGSFIEDNKLGETMPSFVDILKEIPGATGQIISGLIPEIVKSGYKLNWEIGKSVANKGLMEGLVGKNPELDKALDAVYRVSVNDPLNSAPLFLAARGVAGKVGLGESFDKAVSAVAKPVIDTFKKTVEKTGDIAGKSAKFVASQATGLNPDTIAQVILKPESFTTAEMAKLDRPALADRVKTALDDRLKSLSETGKGYNEIRQGSAVAEIKPIDIKAVFDKYGIKFDNAGKIIRDVETPPLKPGDITAFEDFQRIFGNESYLSSNAFLNARTTLSEMARYDATKTQLPQVVARDLRAVYDEAGKTQLPNLRALDAKYAPEVKELKQFKKDYLKSDGTLKDGALNKIANLTGKGKDIILARLEKLTPGIAEDIRVLKAVEDIQLAGGQKVGTYVRAGLTGGLLATGNPLIAVAQLLLSQPAVVIPILRAFGKARGLKVSAVNTIIDKLKKGVALTVGEQGILNQSIDDIVKKTKDIQPGMSIKDITKDLNMNERDWVAEKLNKMNLEDAKLPLAEYNKLGDIRDKIELGTDTAKDIKYAYNFLKDRGIKEGKSQPLAQEAGKYKTAEEFVKAQKSNILQHASDNPNLIKFEDLQKTNKVWQDKINRYKQLVEEQKKLKTADELVNWKNSDEFQNLDKELTFGIGKPPVVGSRGTSGGEGIYLSSKVDYWRGALEAEGKPLGKYTYDVLVTNPEKAKQYFQPSGGGQQLPETLINYNEGVVLGKSGKYNIDKKLTDIFNQSKAVGKPLAQEAGNKASDVLRLMGNDLQDIKIVGSTANGKLKPNDLDILITPKNKLPELSSTPRTLGQDAYHRQDLANVFKNELQPLFPDKKIHITIAEYDPTRGKSMSLTDYANQSKAVGGKK